MAKERCISVFKTLLLALIFCSLSCLFLAAEDKGTQNDLVSKEKLNAQDYVSEEYLVPLDTKSFRNSELFQLIEEEAFPKYKFDLSLIKFESTSYSSEYLQKMIKLNRIENSLYTTSLIALTALNVADYFSTLKALKYEGLKEANPLMKPFTKNTYLFTAVKLGLTAYNFHYMKNLHRKNKRLAWAVSLIANFAMTYIVANNIRMIQEAQRR